MTKLILFVFFLPILAFSEPVAGQSRTGASQNTQSMLASNQVLPTRNLAAANDSMVLEPSWWKPNLYKWNIGYESGTNTTGVLGQNVLTAGYWVNDSFGLDVFLGYTKAASGATETVTEATNVLATPNTKVVTTSYSGVDTASNMALAANAKYRMVQTDWFQLNLGMMFAFFPGTSAEYSAVGGTKTETYADATNTGNKTVVQTAVGTTRVSNSSQIAIGPRIGTEFYIKWFPHLAVGFATGMVTTLSGETTTTTDTATKSYTVTNGTEGTPTVSSTSHSTATNKLGFRGTTFGVGGTTFALTGTFSIRYIW